MKVTQEQLIELVKLAGVQAVEVVEDSAESTFDRDAALSHIDNSRSEILKPKIEAEYKETALAAEIGKLHGTFNSALVKATGASRGELERATDINERVQLALTHKTSQLEGDQKQVNAKIEELLAAHNKELETVRTEYEGKVNEATNKYVQRDIQNTLATLLNGAPLPDGADRLIAASDFQRHLSDKYHVSYNEAGKMIELYQKDNPSMIALNSSNNSKVDLTAEAKEYFSPRGLWREDMRDKNPKEELAKRVEHKKTFEERRAQQIQPPNKIATFAEKMDEYTKAKTAEA